MVPPQPIDSSSGWGAITKMFICASRDQALRAGGVRVGSFCSYTRGFVKGPRPQLSRLGGKAIFICLVADPEIERFCPFLNRGKDKLPEQHLTGGVFGQVNRECRYAEHVPALVASSVMKCDRPTIPKNPGEP